MLSLASLNSERKETMRIYRVYHVLKYFDNRNAVLMKTQCSQEVKKKIRNAYDSYCRFN